MREKERGGIIHRALRDKSRKARGRCDYHHENMAQRAFAEFAYDYCVDIHVQSDLTLNAERDGEREGEGMQSTRE